MKKTIEGYVITSNMKRRNILYYNDLTNSQKKYVNREFNDPHNNELENSMFLMHNGAPMPWCEVSNIPSETLEEKICQIVENDKISNCNECVIIPPHCFINAFTIIAILYGIDDQYITFHAIGVK